MRCEDRLLKCGKAFLKARAPLHQDDGGAGSIMGPGDVFFALDNQKPGLIGKFTDFLKDPAGKKDTLFVKKFTVVYDFDSVRARKLRIKGLGTVNQTETMIAVTAGEPLSLPARKHKHYLDWNSGSLIGMVKLPPYPSCWTMKYDDKKLLYGRMQVPVGGKEDDDADDGEDPDQQQEVPPTIDDFVDGQAKKPKTSRAGDNVEPVHYHTLPKEFFDNLQDAFCIKDVYDFTPSPEAALAFRKAKKGYIAVCFNDVHQKKLREYVIDRVVASFGVSNDPLFHATYAAGVRSEGAAGTVITPRPKPQPKTEVKKKKKDKKRGKEDKKDKKKKKSSSTTTSSSDSGDST